MVARCVERLQKIYGVTDKEVDEVLKRLPSTDTPIVPKSEMPADAPTKWRFVASDGKVDRDNDVVRVEGINLKDYLANPLWTYMHNFDRPIGMGPDTSRQGSKLYSTLELGLNSFRGCRPRSAHACQRHAQGVFDLFQTNCVEVRRRARRHKFRRG